VTLTGRLILESKAFRKLVGDNEWRVEDTEVVFVTVKFVLWLNIPP